MGMDSEGGGMSENESSGYALMPRRVQTSSRTLCSGPRQLLAYGQARCVRDGRYGSASTISLRTFL